MSRHATFVDPTRSDIEGFDRAESVGVVIGVCADPTTLTGTEFAMCERMAFTLTETHIDDTRFVQVPSITEAMEVCRDRVDARPMTTAVLLDVLGAFARHGDVEAGLLTESLAYSTLQAGPEFHEWLADRKPARRHEQDDSVRLVRDGGRLDITFDRPDRHNAFSDSLRAGLLEGLVVAAADPSVTEVVLRGNGPSFCSGGDLGEFGLSADPASAHLARTLHSPARLLEELRSRSSTSLGADVHGAVMGSGLEMASFCDTVTAHPDSVFGLPELNLGLIPGAGGTVSVTRRIGRWRTAYLVVSGARIDSPTALRWGLIDAIAAR